MYRLQWSRDLNVSQLESCPHFNYVQASMELGHEDMSCPYFRGCLNVSLLERCPHFSGCYVQASMELGAEDMYFKGCYVQTWDLNVSMTIREMSSFQLYVYRLQWRWDLKIRMSLLERCPHFRGCYVQASMELGAEMCPRFRGRNQLRCVDASY